MSEVVRMLALRIYFLSSMEPSGMARDMGKGLKLYKIKMGIRGGELHDIFASGPDIDPVTPEEQNEYATRWFASLK